LIEREIQKKSSRAIKIARVDKNEAEE